MTSDKTNQKPVEMKDVYEILIDIRDALKESSKWAKFSGIKEVKPVLVLQLDTDIKKIIYALSDGKNSSYEIERQVGNVTQRTVSNYWQEWEKVGIGESSPVQGGRNRFKASFDLEDFGIKVQEVSKNVEKTEQPETSVQSEVGSHD